MRVALSALAIVAILPSLPRPAARAEGAVRSPALAAALRDPARTRAVWVYFRDKGPSAAGRIANVALSARAKARRALRGTIRAATLDDVPVHAPYARAVAARATRARHEVAWINAMSVDADAAQVASIEALPFVERVDVVRGYRGRPDDERGGRALALDAREGGRTPAFALDYGPSAGQVQQIHVPELHDMGLHGEGVVVAVFDAGFDTLSHEAFAPMRIADRHDFVNGDDDVGNGRDKGEGSHGTETLSTLGGFSPGHLIGPAYAATFLLAKTEDTTSETPVEEDNWAAAAEWAEARGADVISSSLGYLTFDPGFTSYTFADMNGSTAISTRAADLAAQRGVVVVTSAGNEGSNASHNTLGAPADGRLVLAVAAVTSSGARASFSSVGPSADGRTKPDVAAQGVSVVVAAPGAPSSYTSSNGTSFSCPLTAGVVALMIQARPSATVTQVEDSLRSTASQAARPDNLLGWGIVDAARAVQAIAR
jgi:serine protease AprX